MSRYKKYTGPDKYHFRFYRKNGEHPFLLVLVEESEINGKHYLSGYLITHDIKKIIDYPNKYVRLKSNPNPKECEPSYLCTVRIDKIPQNMFSKPYKTGIYAKAMKG